MVGCFWVFLDLENVGKVGVFEVTLFFLRSVCVWRRKFIAKYVYNTGIRPQNPSF